MKSKNKNQLSARDRDFFQNVLSAIFTNPFSEERLRIDRKIIGPAHMKTNKEREEALAKRVAARLDKTIGNDCNIAQNYAGEDRVLVEYGMLFSIYHAYCEQLDAHIDDQIKAGETPRRVAFARECLGRITTKGLSDKEAERYFALFFQLRRAFYFIDRIVGVSPCMKKLRSNLWNNVFTNDIGLYERYLWNRMEDFSTMLLGATGTGKGMAAAAIGRSGHIPYNTRRECFTASFNKVFIPLNLSQFPEQLLESELFGHKKGAFTGAIENHQGIFARCSPHGSIFLDEIGEVSAPVQVKLLNVLQDRTFSPVGSHAQQKFHGRVIAATNRDIGALRQNGAFREDFYYRLCSDMIEVPTLRQRLQEDPAELTNLINISIKRILGRDSAELVELVREKIKECLPENYAWSGNVRELEQCVRRILLTNQYHPDFTKKKSEPTKQLQQSILEGNLKGTELLSLYCAMLYQRLGTYEAVARQVEMDRRTVKKYIDEAEKNRLVEP